MPQKAPCRRCSQSGAKRSAVALSSAPFPRVLLFDVDDGQKISHSNQGLAWWGFWQGQAWASGAGVGRSCRWRTAFALQRASGRPTRQKQSRRARTVISQCPMPGTASTPRVRYGGGAGIRGIEANCEWPGCARFPVVIGSRLLGRCGPLPIQTVTCCSQHGAGSTGTGTLPPWTHAEKAPESPYQLGTQVLAPPSHLALPPPPK